MQRHLRKTTILHSLALPAIALVIAAPPAAAGMEHGQGAEQTRARTTAGRPALRHRDFRATELIGKEVRSPQDVEIGRINDLVLNMDTGAVRYAVLALSGELGPGEARLYAIPVKSLRPGQRQGDIVMPLATAQWREHAFPASRWPSLRDSGYWSEIDRLSGLPAVQPAERYIAFRASELIGRKVRNYEGHAIGVMRDLMVDLNRQKVAYAGVEFQPGASPTGKLYSFPVTAFSFPEDSSGRYETGTLLLNAEPADLAQMKHFDAGHWPGAGSAQRLAQTARR